MRPPCTSLCLKRCSPLPILFPSPQLYTESTDGSFIEAKESALVWHYQDADPDFGSWQVGSLTVLWQWVSGG